MHSNRRRSARQDVMACLYTTVWVGCCTGIWSALRLSCTVWLSCELVTCDMQQTCLHSSHVD
jgi:hypothetical protein